MADQLAPAEDPFSQLDQDASAPGAAPPAPAKQPNGEPMNPALAATLRQDNKPDPFAELGEVGPGDSTTKGAFGRAAARGTLPAAAGLAAMGAGAELGAAAGSVVPGWGTVVGGVGGALAGGLVGGYLGSAAQDWALSKLPDSFVDALGQGERQRRLDEAQHPTATFVGGMTPYAVTMRPGAAALTKLPENATAVQRLVANKATAVLFGGAVNGGMELGQEAVHGDINWQHVAIATGFGMVFNQPTKLGQVITEAGAHPARAALGIPHPTIAQAGDLKVMGPGVTEEVFQGGHEQAPSAAMTAQDAARTEHATIGELPEPDLHEIANRMEPELFARMQTLEGQRDTFKRWMDEGGASDAASRHLAAVEAEIGELQPQVAAAYRRAADTTGTGIVEPEQFPSFAAMLAAHESGRGNVPHERASEAQASPASPSGGPGIPAGGEAQPVIEGHPAAADAGVPGPQRTIGEQRAFIANDVAEKLIAAGRPEEEARAAGQLAAARYVTRAGRFEGKLGTAEELYAREGAAIAGPTGPARLPAQVAFEKASADFRKAIDDYKAAKIDDAQYNAAKAEMVATRDAAEAEQVAAPPTKTLRGRAAADPQTWSLFEFLARNGGLKPTADLHSIFGNKRGPFVPGFGPLLRPGGMAMDEALTRAKEHGYIIDPNDIQHVGHGEAGKGGELTKTVNDLQDMIAEESRGRRQYRTDHVQPDAKVNPEQEAKAIVDALHHELHQSVGEDVKIDPALEDRVVEIVQKEGEIDVLAAYERAIMEDHDRYEGARNARQSEPIQGWDAPDAGEASGAGAGPAGERGEGRLPGQEARASDGGQPRDAGEGHRSASETALAQSVDEYFQRVYHGSQYEPGAEGKPQSLIPGVAPVTQRDLIQAAANKPLAPKKAQKEIGGLFGDSMDQKELFQTARGKIRISPNARPIITLMKDANASTFIHESGHQYLEEMMRDGDHPDAPIALRDDAQTIRDWLGVDGSDEIKTKHHEKFARGFEQYVREGVAPSPELAGVFAKFRNWLLSIYQSIKGLGTEISPEIRGVFDRMLEMEPQRTVIAPERQSPALLHDIHEGEAATVEPHEAEAAMDRVVAESSRYLEEQPPEIQREIETARVKVQEAETAAAGADPAAGGPAGDGAERAGAVGEGGGGPDAQPTGGAGSAEHGPVKPGGGDAGAESAKPIVDRRAGLGNDAATALAPGPADLFGARESPFTDRAGNIRIENLTKHEDVAQAIRDAAQENNDFIGDRRGVITDGQVMELADALGMDARQLNQRHVGQAFNAEQIVAARKLLIQSATDVAAMMKKAATGTDEDVMAYAAAKDRHQMIQAQVSGITAEAGRALRAFRSLAGQEATKGVDQFIREATGKTLFQLRQEAQLGMALDTPQQVSKFMMDAQKRSFGRMILEYWINSILSGPATHATNIIGNSILAVQHFGPESAIAAIVGKAQSALGREGTRVRLGEVKAALGGYRRGLAPALSATGEAARKGASTLLPGEVPSVLDVQPHDALAARGTLNPETTYADVVRDTFGAMRGLRDAVLSVGVLAKGGIEGSPLVSPQYSHLGAIPDIQVRGVTVLPVGTVVRTPGRFLAVADTFFKAANYSASVSKQAYRVASDEGLTGTRFDARVAELRSNPTDAMMQEARGDATSTTLMNKGGQFVQAMNHLTSAVVHLPLIGEITPLKFVNPFVNIAGQIINQSIIQRSPVGLLSRELRADLSGQNGNIAQDMAMARMLMGTAVAITMGGLAAEGYASGSGPKDHDAATMWKLAGNQAHSVLIGGIWYGVNKLGPVGMLMGMAADLYDVAHKAGEGEYAKAAAYFHHALVQNILDQSWMKGPADIIQAVEDPDRYGQRWVQNYVSSFVPNALAQAARRQDPYSREAKTVIDAIKSKIPGLSETLPPRRDIWGEPIPNQEAVGGKAVTGIYVKKMSEDPVNKAMVELDMHPGAVEKKIRNVELTPQQHDDYARIAGRLLKMNMDKIVASDMWQEIPYAQKQTLIQHTIEANRNVARNMVIMKHPQIASDAVTEKLRAIREGKKKK